MSKALTLKQRLLLLEAARRYKQFAEEGQGLTQAWTGLGTVSEYRPVEEAELMRACVNVGSVDRPSTIFWWKLTPKGAAIVKILISAMTLPEIWTELEGLPRPKIPVEYPKETRP